jgi:hypothetical protein
MGYYKRQAAGGKRKSKFDLSGLDELTAKLEKVSRFCHKTDKRAQEIHKRHARNLSRQLKRKIKPAAKDIYVTDKRRRKPTIVEKGTYKRSIGYWQPKGARVDHVYMIGARTGTKVSSKRDAWFQLIVEQDKQYIDGNNRHAGVITAFLQEAVPKMRRKLLEDYRKEFKKLAK